MPGTNINIRIVLKVTSRMVWAIPSRTSAPQSRICKGGNDLDLLLGFSSSLPWLNRARPILLQVEPLVPQSPGCNARILSMVSPVRVPSDQAFNGHTPALRIWLHGGKESQLA